MKPLRALVLLLLCLSLPLVGMASSLSGRCGAHNSLSAPATTEPDAHAHHAMMSTEAASVDLEQVHRDSQSACECGCLCVDHCAVTGLHAPVAPDLSALDLPRVHAPGRLMDTGALRPARRSPLLRPPRSA